MVYYIDSRYGDDRNDGLSRQTAFRSLERINKITLCGGDTVLLKAGTEYTGSLHLKRILDGGLIRIDRYGVGDKPLINGTGKPPILLENFECVELQNIAVTNPQGEMGIQVLCKTSGEFRHVHIRNCSVSHVNDNRKAYCHECGGILLCAWSEQPSWFNDVLIEDNEILDVCRSGIMLASRWVVRPSGLWGKNKYIDDNNGWFPTKNMIVRGNYMDRLGGDGILLEGTVGALIEWNRVFNIMTNPVPPCANAGIWPINSNDCIVQYNEVGYSHKPEGCDDAQGFDVDASCRNTLVQYNYSHDNEGGFILLCEVPGCGDMNFTGTVVRNNLSINDGAVKGEVVAMVGPVRGATVENNTIIASKKVDRLVEVFSKDGIDQAKNVTFRNNLFITLGKEGEKVRHNLGGGENIAFDGNVYFGKEYQPVPNETNMSLLPQLESVPMGEELFVRLISGEQIIAKTNS